MAGAEECYCRAILASPGDGDLLSLYAKLIWETHRDEERAQSYFDQAVSASPDDWYVIFIYLCLVVKNIQVTCKRGFARLTKVVSPYRCTQVRVYTLTSYIVEPV